MPVVMMPVPSGFVSTSKSPAARGRVGDHATRRHDAGDRETVNGFRIADRVAADKRAAGFFRFCRATAQGWQRSLRAARHPSGCP